jgi:hypothetical protein
MGSFLTGAISGYTGTALQRKKQDGSAKKKSPTQQVNDEAASHMMDDDPHKRMMSYKRGGKVRKTGPAKLHKNERVLTAKQTKKYDAQHKIGKRRGRRRSSKRR